ncbi:hypothetical protein HO173_003586 [Letharia columbiana]|uniref:Xylanolytic transcriptional activator regulatory domain-containing protein n=1 Tax=Letharia columbiana TaxID=112416 RepID=A0A8H6G0K3_9LECA|nr:uncharacterized protein HO173_003586 [Letharia columbiana]KAF6238306.1 hypothetical protein HO173_003586 [Letharia columbiana]
MTSATPPDATNANKIGEGVHGLGHQLFLPDIRIIGESQVQMMLVLLETYVYRVDSVLKMFMEEKDKIINRFRLATEVMLSRAKLLTTSDITVLQAFVIYLAGRRTCTGYKKIWTLIASAVRIGQSLGLDNDEGRFRTPFQLEIRRRVWYSIGLLDMQAAFDGGSHSVIAHNGLLGRPPLNMDDSAMSSAFSRSVFVEQPGLTDMSFSCMTHEGLICWRRLTHVPTNSEGQPVKIRQDWTNRSKIVIDWEQRMNERYLKHCDTTQPFQRFMKIVGQDMIVSMRLLERRPMHRLFRAGPPPADDFNVLEVATDVVEASILKFTDPSLAPWSWFAWVKWYILAVVLAELCGNGNGALIDRAWRVAEEAFAKFSDLVIDDVLWRSVERLIAKGTIYEGPLSSVIATRFCTFLFRTNIFARETEIKQIQ